MEHITIDFQGSLLECSYGKRILDFFSEQGIDQDESLIAARFNNRILSLQHRLKGNGKLEIVDLTGSEGHKIYRQTLCFLVEMALHRMDYKPRISVNYSLGEGYFFSPKGNEALEPQWVKKLEERMKVLVNKNWPIIPHFTPYTEALEYFEQYGMGDSARLTKQRNMEHVPILYCDDFIDLDHFPLAPSTGILTHFHLVPYKGGFVLHFPPKKFPLQLEDFQEKPLLHSIYEEYNYWGEVLNVPTVGALNDMTQRRFYTGLRNTARTEAGRIGQANC